MWKPCVLLAHEIGHAPEQFDALHDRHLEAGVPEALVLQEVAALIGRNVRRQAAVTSPSTGGAPGQSAGQALRLFRAVTERVSSASTTAGSCPIEMTVDVVVEERRT